MTHKVDVQSHEISQRRSGRKGPSMIERVKTWERCHAVSEANLGDEMILLNAASGIYFGLDEIGTTIWSMISEGTQTEAIIDRIVCDYDIEREQARLDVLDFIAQLNTNDLLQPARP